MPSPLATAYFSQATLYLNNTDCSPVSDVGQRLQLFNMLVAHIAALNGAIGPGSQGIVGRVSSATEGGVTITFDYQATAGSAQWYAQTPWGAQYWEATAGYRTMQYVPGEQPFLGVPGYGGLGQGGYGFG